MPGGPTMNTPRGTTAPALAYRSGVRRKSTTSLISDLAPSYPATSANVVDGRSSSKILARDRPTPSTPCNGPAAPLERRLQNQKKRRNGARMMIQSSNSEPTPGDDVEPVICTMPD